MESIPLSSLNPKYVSSGGPGITNGGIPVPLREKIGLGFNCPCGCGHRVFVPFSNPPDGKPSENKIHWERINIDFNSITLTPSILIRKPLGCGWHGYVTNGNVLTIKG